MADLGWSPADVAEVKRLKAEAGAKVAAAGAQTTAPGKAPAQPAGDA
jgi:hypothetical protein